MKFDSSGRVEEIVWNMRQADLPRGNNRAILNKTYNGHPPFDPSKAEENQNEINRSFLEGPNMLAQARRQWNRAMLGSGSYFSVFLDSGPAHKQREWGHIITRHLNRELKRCKDIMEQIRGSGANVMLHGIAPSGWENRRNPIPDVLPVSSVMIPSETDINFRNLEYFAVFREMTPAQLYGLTHGPKVDPGWNLPTVKKKLMQVAEETQKQPNSTAYQYMPERIEELIKQDGGYWGSDAVPSVDYWDFYFREDEDGKGWYRRVILDWGVSEGDKQMPQAYNPEFLYTSGRRKYANSLGEILHCQFGDCSAVAPFKYHSVRSLGWMLWGIADLQDRLRCRFSEAVFEQLLWFFRVSSGQDFNRIKKAMFSHMGVIPPGVAFVTAQERFKPDANLIQMQLLQNRQIMSENAAAFTQEPDRSDKEMTATETMARVNAVNTLVSGMLSLAYEYQRFMWIEIARRFCIKHSPYLMARNFQAACLADGVPPKMLDSERWQVEPERVMGGGNKTLEIAQANQLLAMRKNVGPEAQRKIDHIALEAFTDDPALAAELAPIKSDEEITPCENMAQLATERILRGLEYKMPADAVPEFFVKVWLTDLAKLILEIQNTNQMGTPEQVRGLGNLAKHISDQLAVMAGNDDEKEKVRAYGQALANLGNILKAFTQRQQQAMKKAMAANGGAAPGAGEAATAMAKAAAKIKSDQIIAQAKAANLRESHAQRTAQKQVQFEMDQRRRDREHAAELRRESALTGQELMHNRLRSLMDTGTEGE